MSSRLPALALAALAAASLLACGKKGPPLPPAPGSVPRVTDLAVTQVGDEARATFSLPTRPDHSEIDYALLGLELWRKDLQEPADTRGASAPPPRAGVPVPLGRSSARAPFPGGNFGEADNGPPVGDFTKEAKLVASLAGDGLFEALKAPQLMLVDKLPATPPAPYLEYSVVLKTDIRKRGTVSNPVTLEPAAPLGAPTNLKADVAEGAITLSWTAPAMPVVEPAAAPAEKPAGESGKAEKAVLAPSLGFNVYRAMGEFAMPAEPTNTRPISEPSFTDKDVMIGETYRYLVRAVLTTEKGAVESGSTPEAIVMYVDRFPPAAPGGLRLILEGRRSVNLLWNPNGEADLGGYAVYRRETGGQWTRLDTGVARTATFTDGGVVPGKTYEYAVSAYDRTQPPNESLRSAAESVTIPAETP